MPRAFQIVHTDTVAPERGSHMYLLLYYSVLYDCCTLEFPCDILVVDNRRKVSGFRAP